MQHQYHTRVNLENVLHNTHGNEYWATNDAHHFKWAKMGKQSLVTLEKKKEETKEENKRNHQTSLAPNVSYRLSLLEHLQCHNRFGCYHLLLKIKLKHFYFAFLDFCFIFFFHSYQSVCRVLAYCHWSHNKKKKEKKFTKEQSNDVIWTAFFFFVFCTCHSKSCACWA